MSTFRYFYVCLSVLLASCASHPTVPVQPSTSDVHQQHLQTLSAIHAFSLKGRLGVNSNGKGFSGGITWVHQADTDTIDIFTPLGGKVASIHKSPQAVVLTTQDGHTMQAQDAETLTEMALGLRLPLNGLSDWVLGRPTSAGIDAATWDELGRLTTLSQQGWQIDYPLYTTPLAIQPTTTLPSKIMLKNEKLNLRLLIETWHSLNAPL